MLSTRKKIMGIPVIYLVLGVAVFVFKKQLAPLFDKIKAMFTPAATLPVIVSKK